MGANRMGYAAWPHLNGDLASTRRGAALFLDNPPAAEGTHSSTDRQNWVARWTTIGNAHCTLGDMSIRKGAFGKATEAWLCALTAFEVARRLINQDDAQIWDVLAKIEATIQRFGSSLKRGLERVQIARDAGAECLVQYLPASVPNLCAPAVICISSEEETGAALLGRLLPVVIDRGMSILIISHSDVSRQSRGQSEILSSCLDYLASRADVDASRIGVYGEGLSAILATDFASSDQRVAAAVCDGGLWSWTRILASIGWMTKAADVRDDHVVSARRSRLVRQLRCPVHVVAGGRGVVSVSEASKLQADCATTNIDLEVSVPSVTQSPLGEIENFIASDNRIFEWLEQKLVNAPARHVRPTQR